MNPKRENVLIILVKFLESVIVKKAKALNFNLMFYATQNTKIIIKSLY